LEVVGEGEKGWGKGARERNDPKNVCTCEYMNNRKEKIRKIRKNLKIKFSFFMFFFFTLFLI
jgi:hypothetical protein